MKVIRTDIPDVLVIESKVFGDDRGFFLESYNARTFCEATEISPVFVQDNHSRSVKGVLRGLHYQLPPAAQGKLVRCVVGEIFDVAVDIRRSSPTFGKWVGEVLSAANKRQMWIPEGFAHGFLTLSDAAEVLYKTTEYYRPECDRGIRWDDAVLGIDWPLAGPPILSEKDRLAKPLHAAELFA
ncbi:MAG: dTDP-4-dehydrorhamnose 3,5-epimerase [Desulfuromonadales bacterium]|nr:dTDP-4-dehydrorhamnose 3,5-epimerase [Desulfuromonadales bacterium]